MRSALFIIAMLIAGTAFAEDCGKASSQILTLRDWTATQSDYGGVKAILKLQNATDKKIRMVKAVAIFTDPFGDNVARLAVGPDLTIPAKGSFEEKGSWSASRLAKVRKQDVKAILCVSNVLYEDGSTERFE